MGQIKWFDKSQWKWIKMNEEEGDVIPFEKFLHNGKDKNKIENDKQTPK